MELKSACGVFNNLQSSPSVIYGMTDIQKALDEWHKWVQQHGESK